MLNFNWKYNMSMKVSIMSCLAILITTGCTVNQSMSEEKKEILKEVQNKPAEHTWEAERARKAEAAKRAKDAWIAERARRTEAAKQAKNAWKTEEVIKQRGAKRAEDAWKAQEARKGQAAK